MSIRIENFTIEKFRGITDLTVGPLNHVNLIVGNNNCGKTSALEALLLLRDPQSLANLVRIARLRNVSSIRSAGIYESYVDLFRRDGRTLSLGVHAIADGQTLSCCVEGSEEKVLLDPQEVRSQQSYLARIKNQSVTPKEVNSFVGKLTYQVGETVGGQKIAFHELERISGMLIRQSETIKMEYLAPYDHILGNVISHIIRNEDYKTLCVDVLKIFDANITDLLLLADEQTGRPVDYIKHQLLGAMPVSTYGDGIKKVLSLANGIAAASGGILLIDEAETAIHAQYYADIFKFLVLACMQFDVQLFITTHSLETIDAILATQNYDAQSTTDNISVITLKKGQQKTLCRVLPGRQVADDREAFGFEVRL